MEYVVITPPEPFDGFHLKQHILSETGINVNQGGLFAEGNEEGLLLNGSQLTEQEISDVVAAVASYVHPVDSSKDLNAMIMSRMILDD